MKRTIFNSSVKYCKDSIDFNRTNQRARIISVNMLNNTANIILGSVVDDTAPRITVGVNTLFFYGKNIMFYIHPDARNQRIVYNYKNNYGFEVGQILKITLGTYKGRIRIIGVSSDEVFLVPIDKTKGSDNMWNRFEFRSNRHKNLAENNKEITI